MNIREVWKLILSLYKIKISNALQLINLLFFHIFIYVFTKARNVIYLEAKSRKKITLYSLFLISFHHLFLFFFINLFISATLFLCLSMLVETDNILIIRLFSFQLIEIKKQTSMST